MTEFLLNDLLDQYYSNRREIMPSEDPHVNEHIERAWIDKIKSHSVPAWCNYLALYTPKLEKHSEQLLYHWYMNKGDAMRIVYETWPVIERKVPDFNWQGKGKFYYWTQRFVRNKTLKFIVKENLHSERMEELVEDFTDTSPSVESIMNQNILHEQVNDTVELLREKDCDIVKAWYIEGISCSEYCLTRDAKANTAYRRLNRAVQKLSKLLHEQCPDLFDSE